MLKKCNKCNKNKKINDFAKNKNHRRNVCKKCINERQSELRILKITDIKRVGVILKKRKEREDRGVCLPNQNWCYNCKKYKSITKFSKSRQKNGPCRDCCNEYDIKRAIKLKLKAIKYLNSKCCRCGFIGHYSSFDFHHKNPKEKDMNWNVMRKKSWDNLKLELDKCELVCSNCHRKIHSKYNNDGSINEEYVVVMTKKTL